MEEEEEEHGGCRRRREGSHGLRCLIERFRKEGTQWKGGRKQKKKRTNKWNEINKRKKQLFCWRMVHKGGKMH